jgi:hypothetical protein
MEIDFKELIQLRKKKLEERINLLEKVKTTLNIQGPISFSIADIVEDEKYNPRKKGLKVGVSQLNFLEDLKGSYIYIFELAPNTNKSALIEKINKFRSIENIDNEGNDARRATAKVPKGIENNNSNTFYVGSILNHVHSRIKAHIGFGSKTYYAMHLKHWAPKDLKLNFYYCKIEEPKIINDIEAALAEHLNPLIGKREK